MKKIYKLICPIDEKVKYIGQTSALLEIRLNRHISKAKLYSHLKEGKHAWINDLIKKDLKPVILLIEECENNWKEAEKYWINYYSKINKLYNQTEGGEEDEFIKKHIPWNKGGGKWQESTLQLMREAKLGTKASDELKAKLSKIKIDSGFMPSREAIEKSAEMRLKKVLQYDTDGNFEKEWNSVTDAANDCKGQTNAISGCCNGKYKSVYSKIFRHKTDNVYPLKIEVDLTVNTRQVEQTTSDGRVIVYRNVIEAAKTMRNCYTLDGDLNSTRAVIRTCCTKKVSYKGNYFKYLNK